MTVATGISERFAMSKTPTEKDRTATDISKTAEDEAHVPEMAEDFEHTLRRLTIEKQKQRDKDFGLYR